MRKSILLVWLGATGCSPAPFIVVDQSAPSASFTVIPFDGDTGFARTIEREILGLGLRVVERPPYKYVQTDVQRTDSTATGANIGAGVTVAGGTSLTRPVHMVDIVAMYPDANSDYIVVAYASSKELRIIRKKDLSIVGSGKLRYDEYPMMEDDLVASVLGNAGLLGDEVAVKHCKTVTRKSKR